MQRAMEGITLQPRLWMLEVKRLQEEKKQIQTWLLTKGDELIPKELLCLDSNFSPGWANLL